VRPFGRDALKPSAALVVVGLVGVMLVGCAKSPQASTGGAVLRGTVSYRERVALPPDAVVEVKLSEVSRQDVAAPVVAETRILSQGRQVPIPFELRYDPGKIQASGQYALRATIGSGGRILFTTDEAHRVITQGNPSEVDLWLVRAGGSAGGPSPGTRGELQGTAWRLEDLGGGGVLDRVEATLEFPEEGRVSGKGSCNRFTGTVEIEGDSISFGALASTAMACPEPIGDQEKKYFEALGGAERFTLEGSTLSIYSKAMDKPLRFVRENL
jgi:putative lipoprotein